MRIDWEGVIVCLLFSLVVAVVAGLSGFYAGTVIGESRVSPTCPVRVDYDDVQNLIRRQNAIDMRYDAILEELSFERALQCEEQ